MVSKRIVLKFPHRLVDQPIVCRMIKEFDLEFNILKAYVTPREEGLLVLGITGEDSNLKKAVDYVKGLGVRVELLSKDIKMNEDKCTHCGACVPICPADALVIDEATRRVRFYDTKCIACELCIRACPSRALEVRF